VNPILRLLLVLFALVNLWLGAAILIAGVRAALEGRPDRIVGALAPFL
jgi:hypothetical protein